MLRFKISIVIMFFIMILPFADLSAYTKYPLHFGAKGAVHDHSISLEDALRYAIQDEYLAQARYESVLTTFGTIKPFATIKESEQRHIQSLKALFHHYSIPVPENNATLYINAPSTKRSAFEDAVAAEIETISMYDKLMKLPEIPQDVRQVMKELRSASRNHLHALQNGLSRF